MEPLRILNIYYTYVKNTLLVKDSKNCLWFGKIFIRNSFETELLKRLQTGNASYEIVLIMSDANTFMQANWRPLFMNGLNIRLLSRLKTN